MEGKTLDKELRKLFGEGGVITDDYHLRLYEYDGSVDRARPEAVVFPSTTEQVQALVRFCAKHSIPYTARGAGTGLSGGAIPVRGGILIVFSRMNKILHIDPENLRATVQPGLVNLRLSQEVAKYGLYYAPDPSSQKACTIGGNVGENSGGPHTLLYGVTTNHTLGLEIVLPDGAIITTGSAALDTPGYDLTGLLVGSEGTLGIVTSAIVRLMPLPESVKTFLAVFSTVREASNAVSAIIGRGVVPAAIEMMDNMVIQAVEKSKPSGYPLDAGAVLLIEFDGLREGLDVLSDLVLSICNEKGALDARMARDAKERNLLWAGRKGAFGAIGRITPDYYTVDGVVPRGKIADVLDQIAEISRTYSLRIANVFHAGDGNLHPLVLFDEDAPGELDRALKAGGDILRVCAAAGGSITGEHGIGMEKNEYMPLIFSDTDIQVMREIKEVFDASGICNPAKLFPTPGRCIEMKPGTLAPVGW